MQRLIPVLRADSWVSPYPVACGHWAVCSVLGSLPFQPGFSYQGNLLWACCLETRSQTDKVWSGFRVAGRETNGTSRDFA